MIRFLFIPTVTNWEGSRLINDCLIYTSQPSTVSGGVCSSFPFYILENEFPVLESFIGDILSVDLSAGDASVIFRKEVSQPKTVLPMSFFTASEPRFIVLVTVLALIEIFFSNIFGSRLIEIFPMVSLIFTTARPFHLTSSSIGDSSSCTP